MPLLKVNQIASYTGNTLTIGTTTDTVEFTGGVVKASTIQNSNSSNLIVQTNTTTVTIGSTGQTISLAGGASSSGFGATYNGAVNWTSTLVTSALTVSAGVGYFVNTSTAAITLTLPSTPTFGNIVGIVDYSGYASTNNITINPNGNKIEGSTAPHLLRNNGEGVSLNYIDITRGWIPTSGINEGTDALEPLVLDVEYLVVAGGGGGHSGGGGAGGFRTGTLSSQSLATNYTVTVGSGGVGVATGSSGVAGDGGNSVYSTITSTGGGGGGEIGNVRPAARSGGSGGGGGAWSGGTTTGGSGNTPSTSPSQGNNGGNNGGQTSSPFASGGGGGAGAVGGNAPNSTTSGNGGNGTASSITGSSVTYAGGGGGGTYAGATSGTGGTGGGGNGNPSGNGSNGTANTGGGGGGANNGSTGGTGGSGIVILKYTSSLTISNPGGGLTFTTNTSGLDKITSFTAGTGNVQWNL